MLAAVAVVAALSFFDARDDATTTVEPSLPGRAVAAQPGTLGAYLRAGNVELRYGDAAGRVAAQRLARDVAGGTDRGLAAAGQEVRTVRAADQPGIRAVAWRRELRVADPRDPALREFVEHWLGRGMQGE